MGATMPVISGERTAWTRNFDDDCPGCGYRRYSGEWWTEDGLVWCSHMNSVRYVRPPGPEHYWHCMFDGCRQRVGAGASWELAVKILVSDWEWFDKIEGEKYSILVCGRHVEYCKTDEDGVTVVLDETRKLRWDLTEARIEIRRLERENTSLKGFRDRIVQGWKKEDHGR